MSTIALNVFSVVPTTKLTVEDATLPIPEAAVENALPILPNIEEDGGGGGLLLLLSLIIIIQVVVYYNQYI
ncbi:MAG: hypothetical protein AABY22_04660, partial [Nanoarchaeota archaeon]